MNLARYLALALFLAILLAARQIAHIAIYLGFIPWLALIAGIFWIGLKIENGDRFMQGIAPYSSIDLGRDIRESLPWIVGCPAIILTCEILYHVLY